jgi:hypothetical protein
MIFRRVRARGSQVQVTVVKGGYLPLEMAEIAIVNDYVVGGAQPLGAGELAAEDRFEDIVAHAVARPCPFPLQCLRGIHDQHPIDQGGSSCFQEQGNDQDAIVGMKRLGAAAHLGINAGVKYGF